MVRIIEELYGRGLLYSTQSKSNKGDSANSKSNPGHLIQLDKSGMQIRHLVYSRARVFASETQF